MTNAISTISATTPTTDTQASSTSASQVNATKNATASTSVSLGSTASSQNSDSTISPRLVYNPIAGVVVTEFLDNSGQISVQLPSKAAIAYLQAGLTQQGFARTSDDSSAVGANA